MAAIVAPTSRPSHGETSACFVAAAVLKGLHFAHVAALDGPGRGGLVHRDISPDNLLVSADAEVLFISTRRFQTLLQTVPTFAWGIWETVPGRRESVRRSPLPAP